MKVIPATTTSVLEPGKKYKDYSFDELRKIVAQKQDFTE